MEALKTNTSDQQETCFERVLRRCNKIVPTIDPVDFKEIGARNPTIFWVFQKRAEITCDASGGEGQIGVKVGLSALC